ncbi:aldehyde dehydrogenase family protein [Prauserella cavernicola]|uniref:Aldehyde dehydrogenase family protein n=1 Tax=Prauserella cavernicola TaxID=2800127 RepID=A0A934V9H7_9PSEU|nr:aldehyde dehydrogenase family protein [Prauserella cavernicola]MBK1789355.1 aldehyde dehydrogenase family protein [Prauserella cavernicola]
MDAITPQPRAAWIAGSAEHGASTFAVTHPGDDTEVATVTLPDSDQVEHALGAAVAVAAALRRTPAHTRATMLRDVAERLAARGDELAELITAECGKPLRWAETEVADAVSALRSAAREAAASEGALNRLDADPAGEQRMGLVRRAPKGIVLGTVPAHSPLGVAVHTTAAALAAGAPVVLVPDPRAPLSALALGEVLAGARLPTGSFSVLPLETAEKLSADPRFAVHYSGAEGSATALVLADWTDLGDAAARVAASATREAGQSPYAVRRVVVESAIAEEFTARLTDAMSAQPTGGVFDPAVSVGPLATPRAARRLAAWLEDAVHAGAKLLTGGGLDGITAEPTLFGGVAPEDTVAGPVLVLSTADSLEDAFAAAAGTRAGVFTRDLTLAMRASAELVADTVVVGDVAGYRPDSVRATISEFTTERLTVLTGVQL